MPNPSLKPNYLKHLLTSPSRRLSSTQPTRLPVSSLLRTPAWSVASLLPDPSSSAPAPGAITPQDLEHLSRLSALPVPSDPGPSLRALEAHLHFVSAVREADTAGVRPLQSLRDETPEGEKSAEFGLPQLREALKSEEVVGKFHRRIRRRNTARSAPATAGNSEEGKSEGGWDVLGLAERKVGRYFVVDRVVRAGEEGEEERG